MQNGSALHFKTNKDIITIVRGIHEIKRKKKKN